MGVRVGISGVGVYVTGVIVGIGVGKTVVAIELPDGVEVYMVTGVHDVKIIMMKRHSDFISILALLEEQPPNLLQWSS